MRIRDYIIVVVLTFLAAVIVFETNTNEPLANERFFDFPMIIGDWKARDIKMDEFVYDAMETPYLFLRDYYSPGFENPVNLSIVWFDDTNIAIHAPEACLGGVGSLVTDRTTSTLVTDDGREINTGRFLVSRNLDKYVVIYFFDVQGFTTTSQTGLRLRVLARSLRLMRSGVTFVRLMIPADDPGEGLMNFLQSMIPLFPGYFYWNGPGSGINPGRT